MAQFYVTTFTATSPRNKLLCGECEQPARTCKATLIKGYCGLRAAGGVGIRAVALQGFVAVFFCGLFSVHGSSSVTCLQWCVDGYVKDAVFKRGLFGQESQWSAYRERLSVAEINTSVCESASMMVMCDPSHGKTWCAASSTGAVAVATIKTKRATQFVDWSPTGLECGINHLSAMVSTGDMTKRDASNVRFQ